VDKYKLDKYQLDKYKLDKYKPARSTGCGIIFDPSLRSSLRTDRSPKGHP
jgi:hypothetical protein